MDRKAINDILRLNPWFAALPASLADGILREGRLRRMDGGLIYAEGDVPNGLFALISGEVRASQTTAEGRTALLMVGRPGSWVGESSMLDGKTRFSDAHAKGRTTLLQITPAAFARLTDGNTAHFACFVQLVCQHYRAAMDHIVNTSNAPLATRLAQRLLSLAAGNKAPERGLKLSQSDIADTLGVSRQTLNKQLKQFEAEGLITIAYTKITLKRPAALTKLARAATPIAL